MILVAGNRKGGGGCSPGIVIYTIYGGVFWPQADWAGSGLGWFNIILYLKCAATGSDVLLFLFLLYFF